MGLWGDVWINGASLIQMMQSVWSSQRVLASARGHSAADLEGTEAVVPGFIFQIVHRRSVAFIPVLNVNLIGQAGEVPRRQVLQRFEYSAVCAVLKINLLRVTELQNKFNCNQLQLI